MGKKLKSTREGHSSETGSLKDCDITIQFWNTCPPPHTSPAHQAGSHKCTTAKRILKTQILFKKESLENPQTMVGIGHQKIFQPFTHKATAHNKHSLTPIQINIKPHVKGLFTSVPFTYYIIIIFSKKKLKRQLKST